MFFTIQDLRRGYKTFMAGRVSTSNPWREQLLSVLTVILTAVDTDKQLPFSKEQAVSLARMLLFVISLAPQRHKRYNVLDETKITQIQKRVQPTIYRSVRYRYGIRKGTNRRDKK